MYAEIEEALAANDNGPVPHLSGPVRSDGIGLKIETPDRAGEETRVRY
ncbi:MAG: hypothetical protein ACLFR1_12125 [Spirochaetia bacterium]